MAFFLRCLLDVFLLFPWLFSLLSTVLIPGLQVVNQPPEFNNPQEKSWTNAVIIHVWFNLHSMLVAGILHDNKLRLHDASAFPATSWILHLWSRLSLTKMPTDQQVLFRAFRYHVKKRESIQLIYFLWDQTISLVYVLYSFNINLLLPWSLLGFSVVYL